MIVDVGLDAWNVERIVVHGNALGLEPVDNLAEQRVERGVGARFVVRASRGVKDDEFEPPAPQFGVLPKVDTRAAELTDAIDKRPRQASAEVDPDNIPRVILLGTVGMRHTASKAVEI